MANQEKPLKLPHPDFGHVEFHNMSPRQLDVLKAFKAISDGRFGTKKRRLRPIPGKGI